jgi:indole-3-glycerol phosphate synthase
MSANNILEKIFQHKEKEVNERKSLYPVKLLEKSVYYSTQPVSLRKYIQKKDKSGIIAEFKTRSPSMGIINNYADVSEVTLGYMQAGASALSILTDEYFFGGSFSNLRKARKENYCPVLQKDFIIDEYQIIEAKSYGADAILLIGSILHADKVKKLATFAESLGLETLLEIHTKEETDRINEHIHLIGINNRNLNDFSVNTRNSIDLLKYITGDFVKIAESGISSPQQGFQLLKSGFNGLLVGGEFMKHPRPEKACRDFINKLNDLQKEDANTNQMK